MVTDMSEKGLETLIFNSLTSSGWLPGDPQDYDRTHCADLSHLSTFPQQPSRKRRSHSQQTPTSQRKAVPSASSF